MLYSVGIRQALQILGYTYPDKELDIYRFKIVSFQYSNKELL